MPNFSAFPRARLPKAELFALALIGFTAILTETLPAGLLNEMAAGLDVSQAYAGQLVTVYALGSLLTAIPLILWTQNWGRKPTLLLAVAGFLLFNTVTALSTSYTVTLIARFFAGSASGLGWGIITGYARRLVIHSLQGKALAAVMAGTPLALSLGVPAGTYLGTAIGWRSAFLVMSLITLIVGLWIIWKMPDFPGKAEKHKLSFWHVLSLSGVRPVLTVLFCWMSAHTILYTFVTAFAAPAGLAGSVDALLFAFGLAALIGLWLTGTLVDRFLRYLTLGSLCAFCATAVLLTFQSPHPAALAATVILWGIAFGGAATQLATALGDVAGDGVDVANAMLTTVWNCAIAVGGMAGGVLLDRSGTSGLGWAAFTLVFIGLLIASLARQAFPHGSRTGH